MSHTKFYTFARPYGDKIMVRGWDDKKGGHFLEKVPFEPTMYITSGKETEYQTLDGQYVAPVKPGSMHQTRGMIAEYNNVSGVEVYGMEKFLYQFLAEEYPEQIDYDITKIKMWSLDIETASENGFPKPELAEEEVLLITLKNFNTKKIITFGSRPWTPSRDDVEYILCENEYALLDSFVAWWDDVLPEVITGWNVDLFDITYLVNRIIKVCGEKTADKMSPWRLVSNNTMESMGRIHQKYDICGVSVLDYLDVYKKFTFTNRESYRLDVIAEIELGQKKLDHSEFDTFKDFYTNGWDKFVDYNLVDVDLVDQLEEKMKLIDLCMLMAYDAHVNYTDCFYMVRLWDVIIYNELRKKNIVLPAKKRSDKKDQYAGGYVKEPIPGGYDYVVSFDLNSLYPSLIRFLNISPETLVDRKHPNANVELMIQKQVDMSWDEDYAVAANGAMYRKDVVGFMPKLVTRVYDERKAYKKTMLKKKQELVNIEEEIKRRGLSK